MTKRENGITVLTAFSKAATKTFQVGAEGNIQVSPYDNETAYKPWVHLVSGIKELGNLISANSQQKNVILVRGQPKLPNQGFISRNLNNYAEPEGGLCWSMLDFDNLPLPQGINPTSLEAIEHIITKLPGCFHDASYYYQFSSSAGICRADGTPLKNGLNVHLFFWFSRPIAGSQLATYLKAHCIESEFFERTINRGGIPTIKYGVDFSLFRAVQPHYVAAPIIKEGVVCTLPADKRQGLIEKHNAAVSLPEIPDGLRYWVESTHQGLLNEYKQQCGWTSTKSLTKARGSGVGIHASYRSPTGSAVATGRVFVKADITERQRDEGRKVKFATLFFKDEGSPGSWWISDRNPTIARRYGDNESAHLQELSPSAYAYVRDTLQWFTDIPLHQLDLTEQGYLPDIQSFATARNSLVIAPTGSGKTSAFCRFAIANPRKIIIYAAQTVALTRQMEFDLRAAGIPVVHYKDFNRYEVSPAVYVTTNESLVKIVEAITAHGANYLLVIDEAHIALDDFLRNESKNAVFERAIGRAEKALYMTATLSDVQLKKLTETISLSTGELSPLNFGYYQFSAIKQNPLWHAPIKHFWRDFTALLRHYKVLKDEGKTIPRTIIIAATSKMEPFRLLLGHFELADQAKVVSRQEALENEIEEARVGTQPILVSSPLFALGLNFNALPQVFWTYFKDVQVDESQIIQTLNRANRDATPCEVRLYVGNLDPRPYFIPREEEAKQDIEEIFLNESAYEGLLDSHLQIDRLTYLQMREGERKTSKALYQLITNDAIQNYTVVQNWTDWLAIQDNDDELANWAQAEAKERYDEDVLTILDGVMEETQALLLEYLGRNYKNKAEFHDTGRLQKAITDQRIALAMALAQTSDIAVGKAIEPHRIRILMGDTRVFLSNQFDPKRFNDWMKVAAEKTAELAVIPMLLASLKAGGLNGITFGWAMRTNANRRAILASAVGHGDYIKLEKLLDRLDAYQEERREKAGTTRREKLDQQAFEEARGYLATIGVRFRKAGKAFDPNQPVVPDWNFDAMTHRLLIKAVSLKVLPRIPIDPVLEDQKWCHGLVSNQLCRQCVHCEPYYICALGRPIQPAWEGYDADTDKCDGFKKVSAKMAGRTDLPKGS